MKNSKTDSIQCNISVLSSEIASITVHVFLFSQCLACPHLHGIQNVLTDLYAISIDVESVLKKRRS